MGLESNMVDLPIEVPDSPMRRDRSKLAGMRDTSAGGGRPVKSAAQT